jgi:hypothetical protein
MSPFARHGIHHLSPSSLNTFAASPAMFVMEKLFKMRSPVGPAAHRGTAVEDGVVHGLMDHDAPLQDCIDIALSRFRTLTAFSRDPRRDKEEAGIPGMVEQAIAEMRPWGKPTSTQGKVEMKVDGLEIPILGYYDLLYEDLGRIVDLKTAHTLASSVKTTHARQVSLYKACISDNFSAGLLYVTPKKRHVLELENHRAHLGALEKIAFTLRNFLSVSDDRDVLKSIVAPDTDSFYFADPIARQNAFELFGV